MIEEVFWMKKSQKTERHIWVLVVEPLSSNIGKRQGQTLCLGKSNPQPRPMVFFQLCCLPLLVAHK